MCELFGMSAARNIYINDLLREFFSHGRAHPNGWGMAFFRGNSVSVEKEPVCSCDSVYLKRRLRADIRTDKMIAHIRLATKGNMQYENNHPFVKEDSSGQNWTLAHNGTIFECEALNTYMHRQTGSTDSERILYYIIDRINKERKRLGRNLTQEERFAVLDEIIVFITPENKVNLLVYDGKWLYVHTNCEDSLYYYEHGDGVIFATVPLSCSGWQRVQPNTLLAYKDGVCMAEGTTHDNTYHEDEEKVKALFLDYSFL